MATISNIIKKLRSNEELYYDEIIFLLQKYAIWEKEGFPLDDNTEPIYTLCKYKDQFIFISWYYNRITKKNIIIKILLQSVQILKN